MAAGAASQIIINIAKNPVMQAFAAIATAIGIGWDTVKTVPHLKNYDREYMDATGFGILSRGRPVDRVLHTAKLDGLDTYSDDMLRKVGRMQSKQAVGDAFKKTQPDLGDNTSFWYDDAKRSGRRGRGSWFSTGRSAGAFSGVR